MNDTIMFISVNYLKGHSVINDNVADELLVNSIFEAQNIYLQSILGTKLYTKLLELVDSNDIELPVNANYKYLLTDYIQQYLTYRATEQAIPYLMVKLVNKGTQVQNSDWSANADIKKVEYLRDDVKYKCDFYAQRMADFLLDNQQDYPEYKKGTKHDIKGDKHNYYCGVELGCGFSEIDIDYNNNLHLIC